MPDHCHIPASVPDGSLIDLVRHFKQLSSFESKPLLGGFPLWQSRFFDRALRAEDELQRVALYILWNPVRAGLVEGITDYPYSGSLIWPQILASGSKDSNLQSPHLGKFAIVLAD